MIEDMNLAGLASGSPKEAAKRLFRKLLKKQGRAPRVLITDKLKSYAAAKREILSHYPPAPASLCHRK